MLWMIAIVLLILWVLGVVLFEAVGATIQLLLVIAVVVVLYRPVTGRRAV